MKPSMQELSVIGLHTFIVYSFLILAIRTFGRRTLTQLSPIDLLAILLLGSAVETAMVTGNSSLKAGIVSASVLLATNFLLNRWMLKSKRLRHIINGGPLLLVHDGSCIQSHMWRAGLTQADLKHAMRQREIGNLDEVRFAVLESDGRINFVRRGTSVSSGAV